MLDLATIFQGVSAISDVISVSKPANPAPSDQNTNQASSSETSQAKSGHGKSDREIIAEARRDEIKKLRKEREKSREMTQTQRR